MLCLVAAPGDRYANLRQSRAVSHRTAQIKAIFAQRTEKVKVRIGGSGDLPCPLWRVQRHVGGGVRKVYFLHTAALAHSKSHAGQVFSPSSCTYRCQNHRADSLQGRWLLARLRSRTMQSKMRSRLGAFYLFGALGKNSHKVISTRHNILHTLCAEFRACPVRRSGMSRGPA